MEASTSSAGAAGADDTTTAASSAAANETESMEAMQAAESAESAAVETGPPQPPTEREIQDRNLPLANINRIMKRVLPVNMKISKEALLEIQKCISEFISFITSEAGEKCLAERRKTLNGEDILFSLSSMGFDNYSDVLSVYLNKYRESLKDKKGGVSAGGDEEEEEED
jgi:histone H3/H4